MVKEIQGVVWKPVHVEGSLFNSGDFEGLIGIEECADYNLDSVLTDKAISKKRTIKCKNEIKTKKSKHTNEVLQKDDLTPSKKGSTNKKNLIPKSVVLDMNVETNQKNDIEELHAWYGFGLPSSLLDAINDLNFNAPTPIQALTLPPAILGRRDILGAAETGSGKTLAFSLPILTGILKYKEKKGIESANSDYITDSSDEDIRENLNNSGKGIDSVKVTNNVKLEKKHSKKPLYALILTPTRELAVQVKNHLVAVAKYTGIKVAVVLGGMAVVKQERILSKGPEIVVATPGRLWELIQEGNPHLSQVDDIKYLAIDETDRMIEKGHFKELKDLLERLTEDKNKCKERQNFVFSATLTLVHELPKYLALKKKMRIKSKSKRILKLTSQEKLQEIIDLLHISKPKVVDVSQKGGTAETLSECRITCAIDEKDYYVYYFLQKHPGRTLIFCNSIGCVKRLTTLLGLLGCNPMALHASMQQRQRLKNLDRFRDNDNSILIATDVAARGLDIPCVEHVLHYQTPRTSESYVHRSGRTARATREGITVLLVEPSEIRNYLQLCKTLGKEQDLPQFPIQNSFLNAVKERVKLARELDKLELQVKKANSENGWIQKAADEMDILIDDNMHPLSRSTKYDKNETHASKKLAEMKRKQLAALLAKPVFPKGFNTKYPLISAEDGGICEPIEQKKEKAVDALKSATENSNKAFRRKAKWLFKSKSWNNQEKNIIVENSKKMNNEKRKNKNNKNLKSKK